MFNRVFLISGLSSFINEQVSPQIGIGYLGETLEKEGVSYSAFDFSTKRSLKKLIRKIKHFNPDLLGFHLMSHGYLNQFEIIKTLKEYFPEIKIIVGGPHASLFREKILHENNFVDFACILEGEQTIVELAKGKLPHEIEGLISRDGNRIIQNRERGFIKDLDLLPFPTYRNFQLNSYPSKIIGIVTSRGCPYKCTYCPVKSAIGCQYRTRSAENVFEEISYWYKRDYREIWIQDDNFTLIRKRVDSLLDLILKADLKDLKIALPNGIRSDRVDYELLAKMKRAGFFHIAFGVEAGNNKVLANLKKGEKIEDIKKAIELTLSVGIKVSLFFLVGSPGEDEKDIEDSFRLSINYPVAGASFYNLIPFPETELFDYLQKNHLLLYEPEYYLNKIDHFSNDPIFITPELDSEKRKSLLKRARTVSKKVRDKYIKSLLPSFLRFIPPKFYFILDILYSLNKKLLKYINL